MRQLTNVFCLSNFVIKSRWPLDRSSAKITYPARQYKLRLWTHLLVLEKDTQYNQSSANTEGKNKRHHKIKENVLLIGFACLAVILRIAILAFNMREHRRPYRAAPPGVTDFLCVALSAIGTGCVLNWVLHEFPPKLNDYCFCLFRRRAMAYTSTNCPSRYANW